MQGEDTLKTVEECLRGRLLAERAASKAAKENTDLLTTKLKELEEKLKIEEKCRRKAERRLGILKKKLESLKIGFNISIISEESDECSSSNTTVFSTDHVSETCSASISSSSSAFRSDSGDQILTQPRSSKCSNSTSPKREDDNVDQGGERIEEDSQMEHANIHDQLSQNSHCGLNPSELGSNPSELENKRSKENDPREDDDQDNSMALVLSTPVESAEKPPDGEIKVNNESVRQVLDTLKQIKENLQYTMERRRMSMIQVG